MESKFTTFCLTFLCIISSLLYISTAQPSLAAAATTTKTSSTADKTYVKKACNTTTYPKICYKSLSSYASAIKSNPQNLWGAALNLTLQVARNTSALVTSVLKTKGLSGAEVSAVKDCVDEIGDSIDELKQTLKALGRIGGPKAEYEMANMRTWVSAAITDEDTCIEGLDENKKISSSVRSKIRNYILNFARMTSNALALINTLKY
ncbi:invertase/pectin methylesterase inhibitor family protein [Tripterygium wilfordii]|uniref:Invertase/pectin methylesterase inhibitor family protein n=1 Tax=Tripterygium wilfordii TaxID=458696 RepID=A0A7J7CAG0_TRIWF|nr:pectinesterase inhibitor 4-like [Tripterygium wilfordii]KAF5731082.1 invertase/pectin methylesterase inhibitor family protein [Tripterygium wilfordii]